MTKVLLGKQGRSIFIQVIRSSDCSDDLVARSVNFNGVKYVVKDNITDYPHFLRIWNDYIEVSIGKKYGSKYYFRSFYKFTGEELKNIKMLLYDYCKGHLTNNIPYGTRITYKKDYVVFDELSGISSDAFYSFTSYTIGTTT